MTRCLDVDVDVSVSFKTATVHSYMFLLVSLPVLSSPRSGPQLGYRTRGINSMESLNGWMDGPLIVAVAVAASEE
jgi:hypothetical protein